MMIYNSLKYTKHISAYKKKKIYYRQKILFKFPFWG